MGPCPESSQSMSLSGNAGKSGPPGIHVPIMDKDVPKWAGYNSIPHGR